MREVSFLDGRVRLICGDCREVLPTLGKVDAVVTDPPYGINKDGQRLSTGGHGGRKAYDFLGWDGERPDPVLLQMILDAGRQHIIWGGNYFADLLPPQMKWLVWDKGQRINQSDGELAYTSLGGALRICTMNRVELMTDGAVHPTQKPVALMKWCIGHLPSDADSILDPFMGSGSTGVAAVQMGHAFIGIERLPAYFEIACRRVDVATRQRDLFIETPPAPVQTDLGLEAAE